MRRGEAPEVAARRDGAAPLTIKSAISADEQESELDRLDQIVASGTQVDLVCRCTHSCTTRKVSREPYGRGRSR